VIAITTLGIEAAALRERLKKSGLATAVLAYEEGYVSPKLQLDSVRKRTNVERVSLGIEPFRKADDATEEGALVVRTVSALDLRLAFIVLGLRPNAQSNA
jgi:hypothetical protein